MNKTRFLITFKKIEFSKKDLDIWYNVCDLIDKIIFSFNLSTLNSFTIFKRTTIDKFKLDEHLMPQRNSKLIFTYKDIFNLLTLSYPNKVYAILDGEIYDGLNYHGIIPVFHNISCSYDSHIKYDITLKNMLTIKKDFNINYCLKQNILPIHLKLLLFILPKDVVGYIGQFIYIIREL